MSLCRKVFYLWVTFWWNLWEGLLSPTSVCCLSEWLCGLVLCHCCEQKPLYCPAVRFPKEQFGGQFVAFEMMPASLDRYLLPFTHRSWDSWLVFLTVRGQFWFCQHRRQSLPLFILQTWPIASRVWSVIRPLVFRVEEDDAEKDDVAASACARRGSEDSPRLTVTCYLALSCSGWKLAGKGPSWQSLQKFWALVESHGTWLEQVRKVTSFIWKPRALSCEKSWVCFL